LKKLCEG